MPQKTTEIDFKTEYRNKNKDGDKKHRPKISVTTQLFMSILGILLSFIITIIIVDTRFMNTVYIFSTAWQLWDLGDDLSAFYNDSPNILDGENKERFLKALTEIEEKYSISIELFDTDETLIYSSDEKNGIYGEETNQDLKRNYIINGSSDIGTNRHFEIQRDMNTSYRMEYIVFFATLDNDYTLKAYKMKTPMDEGAQVAIQMIVYTSIIIIFIAIIMIRIFSLKFTKPLKDISSITHNMAQLDFSKKCVQSNSREIAMLSDSINEMGESLNLALTDLKQKNQKLQDDYEKEKTLEQLRYEFITGVSHELKTPIAIIQGYAEGMQMFIDSDPENAKQYANIIVSETDRMHNLVVKLLEIIKYDSGEYIINGEDFAIAGLVQEWFDRECNLISDKGISYDITIPDKYIGTGDIMLLDSVINNYLSNAVSHIDGEKIIKTWCEDLGGVYRVSIFNTGKNIAIKDIDKIWTSFYRADKSLSRTEGRFGLGLAIVASIQRLHGMEYGVENMPNGVRFWFDIEKSKN